MKGLKKLTLASGAGDVLINPDNVAFAVVWRGQTEEGQQVQFTRVILKQVAYDKEDKWVDVSETLDQVQKIL